MWNISTPSTIWMYVRCTNNSMKSTQMFWTIKYNCSATANLRILLYEYVWKEKEKKQSILAAGLMFICTIESNALKNYNRVKIVEEEPYIFNLMISTNVCNLKSCLARRSTVIRFMRPNKMFSCERMNKTMR